MLERAPATAESAANFFLRNWEKPHRSTRVLDPKFWRNGTDGSPNASWWPHYLQNIRQIPQAGSRPKKTQNSRWTRREKTLTKQKVCGRPYSISATGFQRPSEHRIYDVFGLTEEIRPEVEDPATGELLERDYGDDNGEAEWDKHKNFMPLNQAPSHAQRGKGAKNFSVAADERFISITDLDAPVASASVQNRPQATRAPKLRSYALSKIAKEMAASSTIVWRPSLSQLQAIELQILLQKKSEPTPEDFDRAWRLFISLENQEEEAASLFSFLIRSNDSKYFPKAREAFRLVPRHLRNKTQYQAMINTELKRFQYRDAMNLAFEASIMGFDVLPALLAYFIQNMLWNSAAELIYRNRTARKDMEIFVSPSARLPGHQMLTMGELLNQCGMVKDLPVTILALTQRLQGHDAAFLEHQDILTVLRRDLVLVCVRSPKAMGKITASALVALFDLQQKLGNLKLHSQALSTIQKLPNRKDKVELALLTYRNFRFAFPTDPVQKWMLGALIATCGEAKYPLHIYDYLLEQFDEHFGQPDALAYQRVMTLCARQGNIHAVQRVLDQYLQHTSQPGNLEFLSPLIYACAVNGDTTNARKQFDRIRDQFGFEQNVVCWNMLMLAHARSVNDVSAFEVFEEMQRNHVRPNSYSYGILLAVCDSHTDKETALSLLADAEEQQIHISVPMINTLIEIYLSEDDMPAAMQLALVTTTSKPRESLTRTWNIFLRHAAVKGDMKQLLKTRRIMATHNIKADDMSYAALVLALTTMKRTSEAVQVLRDMHRERGIAITTFHYSIILHGFLIEGNRDMATVIYNEMKRRFPRHSARSSQAIQLLQATRERSDTTRNVQSMGYLAEVFSDLYASNLSTSQQDDVSGYPRKPANMALLYLETTLQSLIRNQSYGDAHELLQSLEANTKLNISGLNQHFSESPEFLLAKMDLAVARFDSDAIEKIWEQLFKHASMGRRSINVIRHESVPKSDKRAEDNVGILDRHSARENEMLPSSQPTSTLLGAWRTSLSKPLNRYMEAMAQQGRQNDVLQFLRNKFEPAGFQLTGMNWNKYVQILCRSPRIGHHISAFKVAERRLIGRAQSWKLLARGLLRQERVSYIFEKVAGHLKRPILQKKTSYTVAKRSDVMRLNPKRSIPTYTTMVYLGSILSVAERRAAHNFPGELGLLGSVAKRTKLFIQRMPWLKDSVQGEILRNQDLRVQPQPRPRSEESIRDKIDASGILDSNSYIDQIPAEYISSVEDLIKQSNEMRDRLRGTESISAQQQSEYDKRAIQVAEKLTGQVARTPEFLAGQGRLETDAEMAARIERQERQKLSVLQNIRKELKDKNLTQVYYARDLTSPVGAPIDVGKGEPLDLSPASKLEDELPETLLQGPSGQVTRQSQDQSQSTNEARSLNPNSVPPTVPEQLRILESRQSDLSSQTISRDRSRNRLAIQYAELRRVRQRRAMKQRNEAQSRLARLYELGMISSQALEPRTAAGRRLKRTAMAQDQLFSYLQYENDLRHGKRLPPFPKTKLGYRRHRRKYGPVKVRLVADLSRNKFKYPIHRGLTKEKRRPDITSKIDQSKYLAPNETRRKSYRRILRQRLVMRRIYLQEAAIQRLGLRTYERYVEKQQQERLGFQPFR